MLADLKKKGISIRVASPKLVMEEVRHHTRVRLGGSLLLCIHQCWELAAIFKSIFSAQ